MVYGTMKRKKKQCSIENRENAYMYEIYICKGYLAFFKDGTRSIQNTNLTWVILQDEAQIHLLPLVP